MAQSLNALAVGALVKDTGTLYNGKPIIWKIADKGHTGYPSGAVTLITERIISLKCFDAIESGNSNSDRRNYGNNRWTLSNVRQWLNSQAAAGKWYSAQHGADACERMEQLQRIRRGSGLSCGLLRELHCGSADYDPHRRQGDRRRRRYGELHRQNLPCDLYGSRLVRRRDRGKQAGLVQQRQFPPCLPHGGSREQERIHERQFQRKFAVVLVACRRLRVRLLHRPPRQFLWRVGLGPRLRRRLRRSPAL